MLFRRFGMPLAARHNYVLRRYGMSLTTLLLVILIVLLVAAVPTWPYSTGWGYGPSGILGIVLLIVVILMLMGRI